MKTTLNQIREHEPCVDGWQKLLRNLGKTTADDEPLSLVTILDSNGLDDALWCLFAVKGHDREMRLYAVWCARQVQHLMKDQRSLDALDVTEKFVYGEATQEELVAAANAAWAAADAATDVWDAVASAAASAAAAAAASTAAAAAADAATDAANAATKTASATNAAWSAAWNSAKAEQEKKFRKIFGEVDEIVYR